MKTYAEANQEEPFDWNKFLKNAIRRKNEMSDKEHGVIRDKSASWVTCACGNQCDILERDMKGSPFDPELRELGQEFHDFIMEMEWREAKKVLKLIETRSYELIQEKLEKSLKIVQAFGYTTIKN